MNLNSIKENKGKIRIGIPRALLYFYYAPLWETFFKNLDVEIVYSSKTNKRVLDLGTMSAVTDICVPIKIFTGHIIDLLDKNVDYILIPRMLGIEKIKFFCPKFMALPEVILATVPETSGKLLIPCIRYKKNVNGYIDGAYKIGEKLNIQKKDVKKAIKISTKYWETHNKTLKNGNLIGDILLKNEVTPDTIQSNPFKIKVALLGYVYNTYDSYLSMSSIKRLREKGIEIVGFENITEKTAYKEIKKELPKPLFWTFSNRILGAGLKYLKDDQIDGIIHITAFACGPDSIIGSVMELRSKEYEKPFLTIRIDEHIGQAHITTRLEAFYDMIYRKKSRLKNIN